MIQKIGKVATIFFILDALVLVNIVMLNMSGQWGDQLMIGLASDILLMALFTIIALIALAVHRVKLKSKSKA
ncbi:MAG: hypothetical protein RLZZ06_661 [Actinomycetota bacterium]